MKIVIKEAKHGYSPEAEKLIVALINLKLEGVKSHENEKIKKALEPFYSSGAESPTVLGGGIGSFRSFDEKTGVISPIVGKMFPETKGKKITDLKKSNPELAKKISTFGPFVREIAMNLHNSKMYDPR